MTTGNLELLAGELNKLKEARHTAVALDALIPYVNGLLASARAADPETERQRVRIAFEAQIEQYRVRAGSEIEMFKAILESGLSALKSLSVLNGAAAVAILAFLGKVLSEPSNLGYKTVPVMSQSMAYFAFGVGCAAAGLAARYFSQAAYGRDFSSKPETAERWGDFFRYVAIATGIASLGLFFFGVRTAFEAMKLPL